jgi:crossover junction endodeoxyribonuclease RuvC
MRILGIDPGLNITGYGVLEAEAGEINVVEAGIIKTKRSEPLSKRLLTIYNGMNDVLKDWKPDWVAVEELYSEYKHPKTAILMAHARGVIYLTAVLNNVNLTSYSATEVKRTLTGNGRASKEQMQRTIQAILNLSALPTPYDVADALSLAVCHIWKAR